MQRGEVMRQTKMWKKVLGGAIAFLLLAPLPVFAFTYVGPWDIFNETRTGGAPRVDTNLRADPFADVAIFNFGENRSATASRSTISARRNFRAANPNEVIQILKNFISTIRNATISTSVLVEPLQLGGTRFQIPRVIAQAGNSALEVRDPNPVVRSPRLNGGLYRITVTVTYTKTSNGFWNNTTDHTFQVSTVQ